MKLGLTLAAVLTLPQAPGTPPIIPRSAYLPFMRPVIAQTTGPSCAVLDASVFTHAALSLRDLRLVTSVGEVPYTITLSETAESTDDTAYLIQVRSEHAGLVFDLAMPSRPYTDVDLDLRSQDFVATAVVSGMNDLSTPTRTPLGTYTLFDLTAKHLSRDTVLPLQESSFRYLHVELHGNRLLPSNIHGALVPPSRAAQTIYTPVATTSTVRQQDGNTIAVFHIPAHVPLERVSIKLAAGYKENFSREVRVTGQADSPDDPVETIDGTIAHVDLGKLKNQQMAFPAVMGVNLQQNATIEVAIENGGEAPLPVSSITLQMRQRSICFNTPTIPVSLFYGDRNLSAPTFALPHSASLQRLPAQATLGPEVQNPAFRHPEDARRRLDDRPDLVWFFSLACFGLIGMFALHTLRRR